MVKLVRDVAIDPNAQSLPEVQLSLFNCVKEVRASHFHSYFHVHLKNLYVFVDCIVMSSLNGPLALIHMERFNFHANTRLYCTVQYCTYCTVPYSTKMLNSRGVAQWTHSASGRVRYFVYLKARFNWCESAQAFQRALPVPETAASRYSRTALHCTTLTYFADGMQLLVLYWVAELCNFW